MPALFKFIVSFSDSSSEDEPLNANNQKLQFILGCVLAFSAGLLITVNGFLTKGLGINFGEIMVVRGVLQTMVMASIVLYKGNKAQIFLDC